MNRSTPRKVNGDEKKPPETAQGNDLELWRHVTRDTKPLKGREPPDREVRERKNKPAKGPATTQRPPVRPRDKSPEPGLPPGRPLAPGALADVDKRTADRLKRGKLAIEGRLDLHGLRQEEASGRLARFLADAQGAGRRCVLVITGKGQGREGGVIRQNLPHWLNLPANRARLVAFAPAQPKDGGHGAFYVLLKRKRS